MNLPAFLSDLIFPRRCEVCGKSVDRSGRHICSACLERIPFVPRQGCCRVCGRAAEGVDGEYLCEDCRRPSTKPVFDRAASSVSFDETPRRMILDYKFNRALHLVPDFTDWLEASLNVRFDAPAVDLVVPMPVTRRHRWNRGYNQSVYLARELAKRLDRRCDPRQLRRVGDPRRQGGLDEDARRENVRGTFAAPHPEGVRGRTVLLVDDVMTTGATFSEAASTLKEAGASRVWCLSLARSVRICVTAVLAAVCMLSASESGAGWTDSLVPGPMNVVTGVVTYVHSWIDCTGVVASPDDLNGRGVYASGAVPGDPRGKVLGADSLAVGDLVVISSRCAKFLLEPGLVVTSFERIGSVELPVPLEFRYADLATGSCNNRRVRVKGVVRSVSQADVNGRDLYLITLGMADGVLVVRTSSERDWQSLIDAEISVDGVVFPLINNRFEFLAPELEAVGSDPFRVLKRPPSVIPEVRIDGSMSRAPKTYDRHRCRVIGEVTERSADGRRFTIQRAGTALAVHCLGEAPLVGMKVEAIGFPQMEQDVAGIAYANWRDVPESGVSAEPMDISLDNFAAYKVGVVDLAQVDLCNRLVRIRAKLLSEPIVDNGRLRLDLEADGYQFFATLPLDRAVDVAERLRDLPSVRVTGVLRLEFARSVSDARYRSLGSVELRMRTAEDVVVIGDSDSRWRRISRLMRSVGLWALIPLCLFPLLALHLRYHRHLRTRALLADRRRIAHDLHDTISQHMAGAKLLLDTVRSNPGSLSEAQLAALSAADGVLGEARREMREAILDLQNDDLLLKPLEDLIRRLAADLNASGRVRVRVKLRGLPAAFPPGMKRDLLAIVREASSNAISHGKAKNIVVVSDPVGGDGFKLGVYNDGAPFDADSAPGPEQGHFGLTGIRERALRCGFEAKFVDTGTMRGLLLEKEMRT